jgi:hypothetical protein
MGVTTGKSAFQPNIVTDGLVLNLDAINPNSYPQSGTIWYDTSGRNNNGTLINGTSWTPNGAQTSFSFDGVDDYVNLGTVSFGITRDFTMSFWMNMTQTGAMQIFNKGFNPPWGVYIAKRGDNNTLTCQVYLTSGSYGQTDTITNSYSGIKNWTVVRNDTTLTWYVNGIVDNVSSLSSSDVSQSNTKQWRIATNQETSAYGIFKGNIYNQLVYNRGLTQTEVLQNYNALKSRFGLS